MLATAKQGQLLRDGVSVVIAGRPNAGKSSLLNRLAGQERAIVTDIAGTTVIFARNHCVKWSNAEFDRYRWATSH